MLYFNNISLRTDLPPYNVPSPKVRIWDVERGPYGQERYTAEQIICHLRQAQVQV